MDKTMKRQIGYRRPTKSVALDFSDKGKAVVPAAAAKSLEKIAQFKKNPTAKEVISWINTHEMFAWGRMCVKIGIDKANFARTMKRTDPVIEPATLLKIVAVISKYGFGG